MSRKEPWLERRRDRDNYMNYPSYRHPVYGTPLKEPYKHLKEYDDKVIVTIDGKQVSEYKRKPPIYGPSILEKPKN